MFKKLIVILLLVLYSSLGCAVSMLDKACNQASIYISGNYFDYAERTEKYQSFLDAERGWIPGIEFRLSKSFNAILVEPQLAVYKGDIDYDGFRQHSHIPVKDTSDELIIQASVKVGYRFDFCCRHELIPYFEYGYHWWNRESGFGAKRDTFNRFNHVVIGYNSWIEQYEFQYVLLGLRYLNQLSKSCLLKAGVGVGGLVSPKMETIAGDLPKEFHDQGLDTATFKYYLGSRAIYTGELALDYQWSNCIHTILALDYVHYQFGRSQLNVFYFEEPSSKTDQYQFKLGIAFDM